MRLLHTGDWHVGKRLRGRSRDDEIAAALAQVVEAARDATVDAVLVAGDVFELGPITLTALARELGMPVTTMADSVRAMEGRGHLRKTAHHADGRARALSLTASGLAAHRRASRSFERAHEAMSSSLDLPEEEARAVVQRLARSAQAAARTVTESTPSVRSGT